MPELLVDGRCLFSADDAPAPCIQAPLCPVRCDGLSDQEVLGLARLIGSDRIDQQSTIILLDRNAPEDQQIRGVIPALDTFRVNTERLWPTLRIENDAQGHAVGPHRLSN